MVDRILCIKGTNRILKGSLTYIGRWVVKCHLVFDVGKVTGEDVPLKSRKDSITLYKEHHNYGKNGKLYTLGHDDRNNNKNLYRDCFETSQHGNEG